MIAERLRKSVLQAAIQGKLTEQLPEDGDARDLLAEIQAEKTRLIKEGKIKKEKPLPEITEDEIPFEIPENWCWSYLQEVSLKIHYGYTASASTTGNAKLLRITDIQDNYVQWENVPYCKISETRQEDYGLQNRDIVVARTGGTIGKTYVVRNLPHPSVVFASYLIRIVPSEGVNEEYMKYFMESDLYWKQLSEKSQGTGQPNVNGESLKRLVLPLPPLAEQHKVVEELNEILSQTQKLKLYENKLKELMCTFPNKMKNSLLQAAIQGKLTEQLESDGDARDLVKDIRREEERLIKEGKIKKGKPLPEIAEDEIPFGIPDNWCWVRLGDIGETNIGLTYSPSDISMEGTLVLRSGNIQNDKIDYSDNLYVNCHIPERKKCHVGDLLICARNGSKRLVGKAAVIDREGMTFGAFMAVFRSPFNRYIHKYIGSPYFRADLDGVNTTTINQITQNNLKKRLIPLPPVAEQIRIVERLDKLVPLCDSLE